MATTTLIRPTGAALGAEIAGAALADPSDEVLEQVRSALRAHLVLRFRGTDLDDAGYVAFGRSFGEIEPPETHTRTASMTDAEFPEMSVISNIVEGGIAKGEAGDGELRWHTDHGFMERPAGFTMLLAREVPASGGDTSFLNMYRAYEALPDDLRTRVEGMRLKHQASHSSTGQRRPGYLDLESDDPRDLPGAIHPIILRPGAKRCSSAAASVPTSHRCRSRTARPSWMSSGVTGRATSSPGPRSGRSATWSSGTTAAPCTAATASPATAAAACTAS